MRYYKTYNFIAVFSVIAFVGFLGAVIFWSDPQGANAIPMESPIPQPVVAAQTSNEDNRLPAANYAADESISDEVHPIDSDSESLFTQNSLGEISPIQISSSDSGNSSNYTSVTGMDTESIARIIQSDSSNSAASSSAAGSSDTASSSSGSSGAVGSGSATADGAGSSDAGGSGSATADSSGSSDAGGSGSATADSAGSSDAGGSGSATADSAGSSDAGDSGSAPAGGSGSSGGGGSGSPNADDLSKLQPLPKIHYYWPLGSKFLYDRNSPLMYELARLTHSLCFAGEGVNASEIDNCVYTCDKINKTNPEIPCSIGVNYSPWHRKFRPDLGLSEPIPGQYNYTIFKGPTYDAEIEQFVLRMTFIKEQVGKSNQKYGTDVKVGAILLDCERFFRREYDENWNEAMRMALDSIHNEAAKVFPDARIEWYGRGIRRYDGVRYDRSIYSTGKEITPALSCSLYTVPDMEGMREIFRRTCESADSLQVQEVTPWVALASGYKWNFLGQLKWTDNWDYDLTYSYQIGSELNDLCEGQRPATYPSYNRVKVVIFFPTPFEPLTPEWEKHFVEYCKGAARNIR